MTALLAALVAASVYVAAIPALHAYDVAAAPLVIAAAAVASTFVAFLSAVMIKARPVVSYALSLVSLGVFLLLIDGPHPRAVAEAVAHGPNRVLTETLPLSGPTILLSALVVLVWMAGAATTESLVRIPGPRVPFAVGIPIALYVLTYAIASSAPTRDRAGGPLLLVTVSMTAALRVRSDSTVIADADPDTHAGSRLRGPAAGLMATAVVAAVLALTLPTLPTFGRAPIAVHRQPPTLIPAITDPVDSMSQLRDAHAGKTDTELSVQLSGPSTGYLGMADLDDYDGGQWRFSATFQPSGGRIPGGDSLSRPAIGATVTQRIDVTGVLPIPLIPALDRPRRITGINADADALTGMLIPQSGRQQAYTVVSSAPAVTLVGIPSADGLDQSAGVPADLEIPPDTSADLATTLRFLSALTGRAHPAGSLPFLQSVLAALQTTERRVDTSTTDATPNSTRAKSGGTATTTTVAATPPEGTALSEVIDAVTVNRAATPEQFATFFAMVARYLGVPARLVTGFRVASGSGGSPVGPGRYQLTDRQAWAWVEVPVAGVGWVVCDPTPDATTAAAVPPPEAVSPAATTLPPRQANAVPAAGNETGHAIAPRVEVPPRAAHGAATWVDAIVIGAGVIALILAGGPGQAALRRATRRRRRRSPDPRALAVGAWLELLDGLERAGLVPVAGATASEIATEVGHHFGREHIPAARTLAEAADQAVFSPGSSLTYEDALEVWAAAGNLSHEVLAGLDRRQRLRAAVVVGSSPVDPEAGLARTATPAGSPK